MEETIAPYQNPQFRKSKVNGTVWVVLFTIAVIVIGGFVLSRQQKKVPEAKKDVVVEKKEPSPTAKPKIEKSSVKIQVVNGTGTPGQAGIVVKVLEGAGYSADNIKTDNAEKFTTLTTTITARTDFEEIVNDIKDVLKPTFEEVTVDSSNLNTDSEFDIVIVTGGKLFEVVTATPSATITPSSSPSPTVSITSTP